MPVIAVSQLNRAPESARGQGARSSSDLRESGAIEQDADIVMFIYEDPSDPASKGVVELNVAKHRNGPVGPVRLGFVRDYTQFRTLRQTDDYGSRRRVDWRMTPSVTRLRSPSLDPVALLRALGLEGEAPVVLLDSAGGSARLARRHYLAWDPVLRLRARSRGRHRGRRRRRPP